MKRVWALNVRGFYGALNQAINSAEFERFFSATKPHVVSMAEDFRPYGQAFSQGEMLAERLGYKAIFTTAQKDWALPGEAKPSGDIGHCLFVDARVRDLSIKVKPIKALSAPKRFQRHAVVARFTTTALISAAEQANVSAHWVNVVAAYLSHTQMERLRFPQTAELLALAKRAHQEPGSALTVTAGDLNTPRFRMRGLARRNEASLTQRRASAPVGILYSAKGKNGERQSTHRWRWPPVVQLDHISHQGLFHEARTWANRELPLDHHGMGADFRMSLQSATAPGLLRKACEAIRRAPWKPNL